MDYHYQSSSLLKNKQAPSLLHPPSLSSTNYIPLKSACRPEYSDFMPRTMSFKDWPKGTGVLPSDLVNSGFLYTGRGDQVQCYFCGEFFNNWREGDVVDKEHLRLSPHCEFIRQRINTENNTASTNEAQILSVYKKNLDTSTHKTIHPSAPLKSNPQIDFSRVIDVPTIQHTPKKLYPVAPRDIRARLDTAMSRQLLDMGFKKPLLAQVIGERLSEKGDDFTSFMEYFIAAKNAEQILGAGLVDTLETYFVKKAERLSDPASILKEEQQEIDNEAQANAGPGMPPASIPASGTNTSQTSSNPSDISLKRKKECNICMDAEADTVFMPCRHMCACGECGDKLSTCPICRKSIEHCIKVFV